ncbi:MAG: hypothetical protein EBR02_03810 [Alphaproteobacteria bacterium]|nr:hypothetical protein [Alphaproteobacteria bacterium]
MAMDPRTGGFLMVTGVTFGAFATGFGDCLFDIDKIDACVTVARHWQGVLQETGNHIIEWAFALVRTVLGRG